MKREQFRTMATLMDQALALGWSHTRIAAMMNHIARLRGQKLTYTASMIASHVKFRTLHPARKEAVVLPVEPDVQKAIDEFAALSDNEPALKVKKQKKQSTEIKENVPESAASN